MVNVGDGSVHLSHVYLSAKTSDGTHVFTRALQIDQVVEAGKFSFTEGDDAKRQTKGPLIVFGHDLEEKFVAAMTDSGHLAAVDADKKCFLWVVYGSDSPLLQNYRDQMGVKLRSYPVTARLHFRSLTTSKPHVVEIPVVGILNMLDTDRCRTAHVTSQAK